ncbi:hypothetical protein [Bartonella grahamii]|uniref:hypothetical protein n=1 Tax=Bartonella grahamii TaxID=33045 RepID=UPI002E7B737D|nr:hypothetical protein [Bartonella grahamii]
MCWGDVGAGDVGAAGGVGVLLVRVMLVRVMYAMALWRHYGCVSGGMTGEVGGVTYMYGNIYVWVNGTLRRHCWRGRGWLG